MKKEEFLLGLQHALSGEVVPGVVQENLQYYRDYIQAEVQKGRSEENVLEELGDPRLIARTIIDTTPGGGDGIHETYTEGGSYQSGRGESRQKQSGQPGGSGGIRYYDLSKWYWKVLAVVIVVAVISLVCIVVGGLLSLVIPLLPVIGLIMLVMWFVRGPRR